MRHLNTLLSGLAASLLLALPAYADHDHQHAPAALKAPAASAPLQKMQANVRKMQSQLARIGRAKSDEARQLLVAEHQQTLRDNMTLAQEIVGDSCSMMEHGKAMGMMEQQGGMAGQKSGAMAEHEHCGGMMERMQQLEKRVDTMAPAMPAPAK